MSGSFKTAESIISEMSREKECLIVAVDGRCASGKTTLAKKLGDIFHANVIHMDHFFLRDEQRTEERLNTPGGNIDYERFLEEVMKPLKKSGECTYHRYDCRTRMLGELIRIPKNKVTIIEGSYSCHPELWEYYDLRLFMSVESEEQLRRIICRDGKEKADVFKNKWIPLEEEYFAEYDIQKRCDYSFDSGVR